MSDEVQIIFPECSEDEVSNGLRSLTRHILEVTGAERGGGLLGGEFGYGANFENDVFLMHPYCWCDKEDGSCLWCLHGDHPDFIRLLSERFGTTREGYYDKVTHYFDPPHFWYKPTNIRIRWYKWIGRDNAINVGTISASDWGAAMFHCTESVAP